MPRFADHKRMPGPGTASPAAGPEAQTPDALLTPRDNHPQPAHPICPNQAQSPFHAPPL
jgi:hypothetical protein